jgi:hypothetical protein
MRPRGMLRQALGDAVAALAQEQGGATYRDLAHHADVPAAVACVTLKNMVRSGEVEPRGLERVAGSRRPLLRYVPAGFGGAGFDGLNGQALCAVMRGWPTGLLR